MSPVFTPLTGEVYFAEVSEDEVNPFRIYKQLIYPDVNSVLVSQLFVCGGADVGEADYSDQVNDNL